MNTRIIHTKIWTDEYLLSLPIYSRLVYFFLITCPQIGFTGIFECNNHQICSNLNITEEQLKESQENFTKAGKAFFYNGWVLLVNANRFCNFTRSPKTLIAFKKELNSIPPYIIKNLLSNINEEIWEHSQDSLKYIFEFTNNSVSIPYPYSHDRVSIGYPYPIDTPISININNKTKTKQKDKTKKNEEINIEIEKIKEIYNKIYHKEIKSHESWIDNYQHWRKNYSISEIETALTNAKKDQYWQDKITLTILFRIKNPQGEKVDYIQDFLLKSTQIENKSNYVKLITREIKSGLGIAKIKDFLPPNFNLHTSDPPKNNDPP